MPLESGSRLGRYEIRQQLGAGGMGEVYLAEDTELGRSVALKILPADSSTDEQARKRLLREARTAATLTHPHICAVYDVGESGAHRFIAMQRVEGETLDARLKRSPLTLPEALTIASHVADALSAAHAAGVIHRDIKPSNVMITPRGDAIVLDFGLAKLLHASDAHGDAPTASALSTPGAVMGTVPYMSPEQVRAENLDGRSDVFGLGAMLYEMLSGHRPFAEKTSAATASAILTRDPAPLSTLRPDLPAELDRIVTKCLRKNPAERYQSAADLLIDLRALSEEQEFQRRLLRSGQVTSRGRAFRPGLSFLVAGLIVVVAAGGWLTVRYLKARSAVAEIPRLEALASDHKYKDAYALAVSIESTVPANPTLVRLMPTISMTVTARTTPAGAHVYVTPFDPADPTHTPSRQLIGTTPLTDFRIARGEYVLSMELEGYAPIERTISGRLILSGTLQLSPPPVVLDQALIAKDKMPDRMVFVPGGDYRLVSWSRPTDRREKLDDFFIDKYEVTNQEYKDFINAGGYLKKEYWTHPFTKDGRTLSWDDAMKLFVDRSGLPGPRSWSDQHVPEGKADHPVTDISWYEAAAYAAYRGRTLPTVFQWEKAARNGMSLGPATFMPWGVFYAGDTLAQHANFEASGTVPANALPFGMSPFGAYNMAGNVVEWTMSDTSEGLIATGGAWGDPTYTFAQYQLLPGFFTSSKLGFRCAQMAPGGTGNQGASRIDITQQIPVFHPTSDADFKRWSTAYDYAKAPLDAHVDEVVETPEWRREKISFAGANGERAIAYLYLPPHFARPLQVIHFVPAADVAGGMRDLPASVEDRLASFIKSGRAAFGVVLHGYIGRLDPPGYTLPDLSTVEYLERVAGRMTDLRRGLDYLETRQDVDVSRLAFFGPSAGAQLGLVLAAIEPRYRAVALAGAGLSAFPSNARPEVDPSNFASHIRVPKFLLQGRYDEDTPLKVMADPLFALLPQPKERVLYEGGHVPPADYQFSQISAWLDRILGPVKR